MFALGTIKEIKHNHNRYYYLVVYRTCPVEIKHLRFCVWNVNLLQNKVTGKKFEIGDKVRVSYHYNTDPRFPWLDELIPVKIDETYPICDTNKLNIT